ncbi:3-hydroxybenzoate 6-monooxygenase [Streptomyces sp. SCSIO ZS0520]|uniref:3-hydroxybenzoate 6-monooxygenase n=1 Tax=Streptomyces sp. SCSIO ZS0520 TaxID=2892996 RepID=UPI0021DA9485|nr:3-hydroxybenzoate 6-monooxygenase [Streptomyces sp. SCSIO ZS0520]
MAHILIAGGGIGGLAAALGLTAKGHRVTVLERGEEFTELGAGIQLGPNAFHALDRLGVAEQVRARAVFIDALRLKDGTTGELINAMPLTEGYRERFGNPYAVVHRIDLYRPLLDACRRTPAAELLTDSGVVEYTRHEDTVSVRLADGRRLTGDALIGADGIRSAVRGQLVGDGEPRVSGHTIYRSVIPMDEVPQEVRSPGVTLWAGPRWHFVHYAISGGRQLNMAMTLDDGAREAVSGRPATLAEVRGRPYPGMCEGTRRLLELGRDWRCWVLCDRDPLDVWVQGRVALLGDAAHPMLQYAAQGACQALEDAVVLGGLLDGCPPAALPGRLLRYNAVRRDRTARAQLVAREMGRQVYHPDGVAAKERNVALSALSPTQLWDKVDWLHADRDFFRSA